MFGGVFDVSAIELKIAEKEELSGQPNFWDSPSKAERVLSDIKILRNRIEPWKKLIKDIEDLETLYELAVETQDLTLEEEIKTPVKKLIE